MPQLRGCEQIRARTDQRQMSHPVIIDSYLLLLLSQVEAVKVHYLIPRRYEVMREFLQGVLTSVDFRQGSKLGVRTEDKVYTSASPF